MVKVVEVVADDKVVVDAEEVVVKLECLFSLIFSRRKRVSVSTSTSRKIKMHKMKNAIKQNLYFLFKTSYMVH